MEIRSKTIKFEYRHFEVGEKVKASCDFTTGPIRPGRVYTVRRFAAPEHGGFCGEVAVYGVKGMHPDWYFDPVATTQ